jgi:hypothetical protein
MNREEILALEERILANYLLRFSGHTDPGGPPGPAPAAVTPAVAALVRARFRWSHRIHRTGGPHGY